MKHQCVLLFLLFAAIPTFSQQLPTGTYRPNRERGYDILHCKATLRIDWKAKQVIGEAVVTLHPLAL